MRALAVLAVFLYHARVGWMPGGFLGVDVFFVISGYLITSLLLRELRRGRHVRLGRFWLRRVRRLLPAVGVFIAVTVVAAAILEPDRIDQLRGDAIASLAYVANWHFVFSQQSYFALAYVVLSFIHVHDYDLALYHGGYLWLALVTALLLAVLAHPAARLGSLLGQAPVLWLGLRSYSFYLWHYPVLMLTRPGSTFRCRAAS